MSNAITVAQPIMMAQASMVRPLEFSADQRQMIRDTFANGCNDSEFAVLMEVAKARNLNPLLRQIHFVQRWDGQKKRMVWSTQASIDGIRAIAERTGRYEGQTSPQWCGPDGKWVDVWLDKNPPAAARVGVHKSGFREPAYGIARWESYVQTKKDGGITQFWARMPDLMLAKCAEALALRKAFPEDTGGLYIPEEMGESVDVVPSKVEIAQAPQRPQLIPVEPPADVLTGEVIEQQPATVQDDKEAQALQGIRNAKDLGNLKALVPVINSLPEAAKARLRSAYTARHGELSGAK